jgi:hypothetical protein
VYAPEPLNALRPTHFEYNIAKMHNRGILIKNGHSHDYKYFEIFTIFGGNNYLTTFRVVLALHLSNQT